MKMEIKKEFDSFKAWINIIRALVEEQTIEAKEDGLHVIGMDPSHVAMISTIFRKELFDAYDVEEDDKVTINVKELYKFLDRIKDERVVLEHDVKRAKFLINLKKGTRIRQFDLPTMEGYEEELPQPKLIFKAKARITHEDFSLGLNDAQLVSEHIVLDMDNGLMKLKGTGDMGGSLAQWDADSDAILELKATEEAKATFTLTYLADIVKAVKPLAEVLTIELSTDMPIRIEAECSTSITAEFFLAPCIGV